MRDRIYHATTRAEWDEARVAGSYTRSTKGRSLAEVGYIHASTATQLPRIAALLYGDGDDVVVLVIDPARVGARVVFEQLEGSDEEFPHIYGPLPVAAVEAVVRVADVTGS
jgi:uncharacterized protein (DUF952 family)